VQPLLLNNDTPIRIGYSKLDLRYTTLHEAPRPANMFGSKRPVAEADSNVKSRPSKRAAGKTGVKENECPAGCDGRGLVSDRLLVSRLSRERD